MISGRRSDLRARENLRKSEWDLCARNPGGDVVAGGSSKRATRGGQIRVACARRAALVAQLRQKALDVVRSDSRGCLAYMNKKLSGATSEGGLRIRAQPTQFRAGHHRSVSSCGTVTDR